MAVPICESYASEIREGPMIRMPSQSEGMSVLIVSCGLILLSGEHSLAAESSPPSADTTTQPRALEEFKPLTGLDNTPRGGTLPGGTLPGGTLPSGTLPAGTLPGGTLPGGTLPGGTVPGGTLPGGTLPGGTLPGGTLEGGPL